jgi:hypothetical protein
MGTNPTVASRYTGPDRRRHRVYVTHNTEYHLRDGVCVAVRNRTTGEWHPEHDALGRRLQGGIHLGNGAAFMPYHGEPVVGDAMYFELPRGELVTSRVERVERPPREVVARYPHGSA